MVEKKVEQILDKYGKQLSMLSGNEGRSEYDVSSEFMQFKGDMMPQLSRYEKWCNNIGGMIKLKLAPKDETRINSQLEAAHLNVSAGQVVSLAMLSFILVFISGLLLTVAIYLFTLQFSFLLVVLSLFAGGFLFYYFYSAPERLANKWRLQAGSQMVPCILYTVVYMKHTSNLERAIRFASQHLAPPL